MKTSNNNDQRRVQEKSQHRQQDGCLTVAGQTPDRSRDQQKQTEQPKQGRRRSDQSIPGKNAGQSSDNLGSSTEESRERQHTRVPGSNERSL